MSDLSFHVDLELKKAKLEEQTFLLPKSDMLWLEKIFLDLSSVANDSDYQGVGTVAANPC